MLAFYERPFRAKLIPSKIWEDLDNYKNDPKGLSNYFKKWRTKIIFTNPDVQDTSEYISIGGEYEPDTRQCIIYIYTDKFESHKFRYNNWSKFKYRLIQTLMHEMVHFMQFTRRGDEWSYYVVPYKKVGKSRIDSERRYLSAFDEIQAYAHCAYLDFKCRRPNIDLQYMLKNCKKRRDSATLHYFLNAFNYDFTNNKAPRKIIDQIGKWDRKYSRHLP